ncbi:cation transporter [Pontibacter sp. KCTC 32443]|uniref:cation transporter n=1 Tax=Pontibacter TaxID=323449 RepID=UPI00164CE787|nr:MULTISPECIES: cation diffusion facilitator family transporter [Pontibacter]MBC5772602.1 cation transporter [Pontibacter sp. KCTC 32443]
MVNKSTFRVSKMDCPSEEQMIRMKLEGDKSIKQLDFDIPNRLLTVYHSGGTATIAGAINELNLNSTLLSTEQTEATPTTLQPTADRKLLWIVLLINSGFFLLEIVTGFISKSMGLVADSLDMLADAFVYGLALFAVGGAVRRKKSIARISGFLQLGLAVLGFFEVIRRFLGYEEVPVFQTMIIISFLALIGNATSLYILQKSGSKEAHMQASVIFTSNDVIANIGVIIAGSLVYFTNDNLPDLLIGAIVFLLVARGAFRILKLAN